MNHTTRRYPRTHHEAFKGPEYACPVEYHKTPHRAAKWVWLMVAIAMGGLAYRIWA